MDELSYVYLTLGVMVLYFVVKVLRRKFDPFAPIWLFLTGYLQVYVVQAISYHDYALRVRGLEVTTLANSRSLWALILFLFVYEFGLGKSFAAKLPKPPTRWSLGILGFMVPIMVVWGLICGYMISRTVVSKETVELSAESMLLLQFPVLTLVAGICLIVTGRSLTKPRPLLTLLGLGIALLYVALWMFNGKRSHSLLGVLSAVCAYYTPRLRRPSGAVLIATALVGAMAVGVSIGWRNDRKHERSLTGFIEFIGDFDPSTVLASLNIDVEEEGTSVKGYKSRETEEYGGYLLMLDTVPIKSEYDYGASYIRLVSTFIPRIVWPDKPYFGREQWIAAWIAGSEFKRKPDFTGPAISILGATQLNGGAFATAIVLSAVAILIRMSYEYFLRYGHLPWTQAWWALTFYNAWFMTVNDDPFVWFYYAYGFTTFPPIAFLWIYNRIAGAGNPEPAAMPHGFVPSMA